MLLYKDRRVIFQRSLSYSIWEPCTLQAIYGQTSSSSSGPRAYAPHAPQPMGLLCNP